MEKIILASASPRRFELLNQIGISFEVIPANIEEQFDTNLSVEQAVQSIACQKALCVAQQTAQNTLVIGADTVVVKGTVLGKPKNETEAYDMLKALQGSWHEVITGMAVVDTSTLKTIECCEKTRVKMRCLSDQMIFSYIKTGEPMDKAGAYGIQGMGAVLVERIEGCYFNVVGLPLMKLSSVLEQFEVPVL